MGATINKYKQHEVRELAFVAFELGDVRLSFTIGKKYSSHWFQFACELAFGYGWSMFFSSASCQGILMRQKHFSHLNDGVMMTVLKWVYTLLIVLLLAGLTACGSDSSDSPADEGDDTPASFDHGALLENYAAIMQAGFSATGNSVGALDTSIVAYCDALGEAEEQNLREQAQTAFKAAMNDVQHSLLHGVGPALELDRLVQLYSWPLSSTCQIDLKLANDLPELNVAVNKRGLDALEYLLFVDPAMNHSCPDSTVPNPPDLLDNFDALDASEKQTRRCEFMRNVSADAVASAEMLANAWDPNGGNYGATLIGAENPVEALNSVTDAMFYFEKTLKENKLDQPLGGTATNTLPTCGAGQPCPQDVEAPHARISKENLRANVVAFQALYLGGDAADAEAQGFDDWLVAVGEETLATNFAQDIQAVIDAIDGIEGSLYDAIENDIASVNALLLGPVQDVSQPLRANILQALGLQLPKGSESDTD